MRFLSVLRDIVAVHYSDLYVWNMNPFTKTDKFEPIHKYESN